MLMTLMEKVNGMQEQMGNVSRMVEIQERMKMKCQKLKNNHNNIVTEMKIVFNGLISILNITKERISGFEDRATETSQTQTQK